MRRDPLGLVSQQILTILETHARRSQPVPKGMTKVMHSKSRQLRPDPRPLPCRVEHIEQVMAFVGENEFRVLTCASYLIVTLDFVIFFG